MWHSPQTARRTLGRDYPRHHRYQDIGRASLLLIKSKTQIGYGKESTTEFLWIALLVLGTIWILARHNQVTPYQTDNGLIFGTVYKVTYQCDQNLKAEIEAELKRFDGSLSPFNDTATITRINRNEDIVPDTFFTNVFRRSMEISRETDGAFDITVAPLANAWGFGFKKGNFPDSAMIDSLLEMTGYEKVKLSDEGKVVKTDPRIMLSCSAVAKGYAVDVIAQLLKKRVSATLWSI